MERLDVDRIADELADCRQRGLDWLDRRTTNQAPVQAAALQQLAEEYAAARGLAATGRVTQIKTLLRDGITALAREGHVSDADMLRDLFFGESLNGTIKSPGLLLKRAMARAGDTTEARFRERRATALRSFALFLLEIAVPGLGDSDAGPDADVRPGQQQVGVGYVGDNEHFIELLARAVNVTVVGITNEKLALMLEEALRRKRAGGRSDAFWDSLRIVFLGNSLLGAVNDEREELQDSGEALRQRRQDAAWARRSIRVVLKRGQSTRWTILDCPYLPVLTGALLEFGDNTKIAHLLIRRPRRPTSERLYIELEDVADRFSAVFEDIVRNSVSADMIVPAGFPADGIFHYVAPRLRANVLKDGSDSVGWLPMVLVITPRRRGDQVEAMLQLRTPDNSERELHRVSHLTGHILQDDRLRPLGQALAMPSASFGLEDSTPLSAAQRVVQNVTGDDLSWAMRPAATGGYLYPDKEHLFFFVFMLDTPAGIQFPRRAEMRTFPLSDLLAIRASYALRGAARLCRATEVSEHSWRAAAEVVALNLTLHDCPDLAETLLSQSGRPARLEETAAAIDRLVEVRTSPSWVAAGKPVEIDGLAGWQHREFFSVLLRLYQQIGISGADDLLDSVKHDRRKDKARSQLASLYQDEQFMASLPVEL
jgi:hypothetical protein